MRQYDRFEVDVLVLGAGLAGMRAAWSALAFDPSLNVVVVSPSSGPSGSSFSNINDQLGIQVCLTDRERQEFAQAVLRIAAPGYVDPSLVEIMALESEARCLELEAIGLSFDRDSGGRRVRLPGCFDPAAPRAYILSGLGAAFATFKKKVVADGGAFVEGFLVQDMFFDQTDSSGRVCGALLHAPVRPKSLAIKAKAVVVALGGPAPLFAFNVAGSESTGYSYALLKRAGVQLVNQRFLQFLWHTLPDYTFWPIQELGRPGTRVTSKEGDSKPLPGDLKDLCAARAIHCPVAYGHGDEALDKFLVSQSGPTGLSRVFDPDKGWLEIALMAHAGNGGAKIDLNGWTGIPGLFACGESAGGMHGANRIGGAMVLATQVFGCRAGHGAARYALDADFVGDDSFLPMVDERFDAQATDDAQYWAVFPWLKLGLQRHAIPGGRPGLKAFMNQCQEKVSVIDDWRLRLVLESALIMGTGK